MHNRTDTFREVQMNKEKDLINAVLKQAQKLDGTKKLTCAEAFELAKKYKVDIIGIGRICNQHRIRICKCQLGCFK